MEPEGLAAHVQMLLDIEELKNLKARYFRFLDTQQWDEWLGLFTEDFSFASEFTGASLTGRASFVLRFRQMREGGRSVHHGHMPEVHLTGSDAATGVWAFDDFVEEVAGDGHRISFRGNGYYHEQYVRQDGRWLISSIRLVRLRVDTLDTWSEHLR